MENDPSVSISVRRTARGGRPSPSDASNAAMTAATSPRGTVPRSSGGSVNVTSPVDRRR